jgi:hypothetical protein
VKNIGVLQIELENNQIVDATDNLIEQQFYKHGTDTIIGRTPEIAIKIKNSGLVIRKYKDLFKRNSKYFIQGDIFDFLKPFTVIKGIDDNHIKEIYQEVQIKLAALQDTKIDSVIRYTIILSSLISRIRNIQFNESIEEIITRIRKKKLKLKQSYIHEKLESLFMRNDKNVSILYNIAYLDALAESFNFHRVAHTCKIQKSKYINIIVNYVLFSDI